MAAAATETQGTAIAKRDTSDVGLFQRQLETRAHDIQMALPSHIKPDKFQRSILTAVAQNQDLLRADRNSLILACYKAAQDALLPDGREAALVTFNTRFKDPEDGQWKSRKLVQYMPMVYGLRKKILQSGDVVSLEVNVIYRSEVEKGTFLYEVGLEPPLRHRPSLDLTSEETTDDQIIGAYSIATMKDGTKSYEIMRRFEIDKVRQVSQTGATGKKDRQGNPIEPKGPWVEWFAEMAKKTVMRRHAKTLPMSGDIFVDVEGREFEHSSSAALALGSAAPDAPTLITDENGDTIDTETGEILGEGENVTGDDTSDERVNETAKTEQEKPKAPRGKKADRQPETAQATTETAQTTTVEDERGFTKDPAEAAAEKLLGDMAEAGTIIDLERIYNASENHREAMPTEILEVVANGYQRHRKRLTGAREEALAK